MGKFNIAIKPFKIQEMIKAIKENRLYEAFGAGTAVIVSPVESFKYNGEFY